MERDDVNGAVFLAVVADVIYDRAERSKSYTAGNEHKVLARELGVNGEAVAVGTADGQLLTHLDEMEPCGEASAFLDAEFHILAVCGRRGYREHRLALAGDGEHGALTGDMLKALSSAGSVYAEGLYIGGIPADIGDNADMREKKIATHYFCSFPSVLMTLTMLRCCGHITTHLPQPTQENMPSLLSG